MMDSWTSTIATILTVYLMVHIAASLYSHTLYMKTGVGMTPDSTVINLLMAFGVVGAMTLLRYGDDKTAFGALCACMLLRVLVFGIARNIKYYFVFKAKLRHARVEYKRTGTKSVLSIPGYTSLNTLMLATVAHIVGVFALGVAVYYAFVGLPIADVGDMPLHDLSYDEFQKLYNSKS